jgi:hypothetical protein
LGSAKSPWLQQVLVIPAWFFLPAWLSTKITDLGGISNK